jgi:hypothetical protein
MQASGISAGAAEDTRGYPGFPTLPRQTNGRNKWPLV